MSTPVGKEANSSSDNTAAVAAAESRRKRKTFKRGLKGTVGAVLVASSAVLIARSDEIGEWLQSAATNVQPHTAAGADIVLRAIAEAKICLEKGANVCLDAEGRVTAVCEWMSLLVIKVWTHPPVSRERTGRMDSERRRGFEDMISDFLHAGCERPENGRPHGGLAGT